MTSELPALSCTACGRVGTATEISESVGAAHMAFRNESATRKPAIVPNSLRQWPAPLEKIHAFSEHRSLPRSWQHQCAATVPNLLSCSPQYSSVDVEERRKRQPASFAHVLGSFGEAARALDITADALVSYAQTRREEGASPATAKMELALVRRGFNLAIRAGCLPGRPAFPVIAPHKRRTGFFEEAENIIDGAVHSADSFRAARQAGTMVATTTPPRTMASARAKEVLSVALTPNSTLPRSPLTPSAATTPSAAPDLQAWPLRGAGRSGWSRHAVRAENGHSRPSAVPATHPGCPSWDRLCRQGKVSSVTLAAVTSDASLDAAFAWPCERRLGFALADATHRTRARRQAVGGTDRGDLVP